MPVSPSRPEQPSKPVGSSLEQMTLPTIVAARVAHAAFAEMLDHSSPEGAVAAEPKMHLSRATDRYEPGNA